MEWHMARRFLLAAAMIGLLGSCSDQGNTAATACATAAPTAGRPAGFPQAFPLPPGTVLTASENRSGGRALLYASAPLEAHAMAKFFEQELPKAGFKPGKGESESQEAEADFSGAGLRGHWLARNVSGCSYASDLSIVTGP